MAGIDPDRTWWRDGLPFTCVPDCGRCCNEPGGIVNLSQKDAEVLARHFEMDVAEWLDRDCRRKLDGRWVIRSREEDGICIYLDEDMSCSVYSAKPTQCSAFPWWAENLRSERTWRKTARTCPGLAVEGAPIIPAKEIAEWIMADMESSRGFRHLERE